MTSWLLGTSILLIHLLGIVSAIMALMSSRTSQGAVAWIISLLTFPYVALPAYWFFGRPRFYGYVSARGQRDTVLRRVLVRYRANVQPYVAPSTNADIQAVEQLAMMPLTHGNQATLLIDGPATFESLFDGIDRAEQYALVQFFIVRNDALGQRLKHHLQRAARRGVRVYFLYDEVGSRKLADSYLNDLISDGVAVSAFRSSRGFKHRFQLNFRNHRKITVIDGKEGWIGGFNIGVEYLGENPRHGPWRDTHLKLAGPAYWACRRHFGRIGTGRRMK